MTLKFLKLIFPVIIAIFAIFPCFASAQSLYFISDKNSYETDDIIVIKFVMDLGFNAVNAISGTVNTSKDFFEIQSILTGKSVFTLWPERPSVVNNNDISFAGGVPKGVSGNNLEIFSIVLKAKKTGSAVIFVKDANVLLNDGRGTKLKDINLLSINLNVQQGILSKASSGLIIDDRTGPDHFIPILSRDQSVAKNKYFVSFSTTDKESGISHYEVREDYVIFPYFLTFYSTGWKKTETPYVLSLQNWWSKIYVRAYDIAGNYTEENIKKPISIICVAGVIGFALILSVAVFFILKNKK